MCVIQYESGNRGPDPGAPIQWNISRSKCAISPGTSYRGSVRCLVSSAVMGPIYIDVGHSAHAEGMHVSTVYLLVS